MSTSVAQSGSTRWPLLVGLGVSLCAHLAAAGVLAVGGERLPVVGIPPTPPAPEERLRLGIEQSEASTITWLGFEEPTPHEAPQANIDQAAFAIAAAERLADQVQMAASRAPEAIEALAAAVAAEQARLAEAMPSGLELPEMLREAGDLIAARPEASPIAPDAQPRPAADSPANPSPDRSPAAGAAGQATAGEGNAPESAAPRQDPDADGEADRDSPARSSKPTVKVTPGRPVAAEGLDIQTVRAKWTHTTLLTTRPKNPVIRVFFRRDGAVERAVFERSSGTKFVDEPLLNAVYQWKARGKALEALTAEGEGSTIEIVFEIGLQ